MGSLRSGWLILTFAAASLCFLGACGGGHRAPGPSPLPIRITLTPSTSATLQLGNTLTFTASAQNGSSARVSPTIIFASSNTDILNIAPNGVACAGRWDAFFTTCTPQSSGVVQVTATALGATSAPTLVFVHPPIDSIQISEVPPVNSPPPACPGQQIVAAACAVNFTANNKCLSQNQVKTLQAQAFSHGVDITAVVGPFSWTEGNGTVVKVTPITTSSEKVPTNQATVTPNVPGFTSVFATASGTSSQPYYAATCPVQCIALQVGPVATLSGQTSFAVNKGTSETITATAVDVQGCVVPKPPLTWTSSEPASVLAGSATTGCPAGETCAVTTPSPGSGSVTASCTPPSCNIGFPQDVSALPQALVPPFPVYPETPISGLVNGTPSASNVLVTSFDCKDSNTCGVAFYNISTTTNQSGIPVFAPVPPNSLLFDLAGDKAYMGSDFGAFSVSPTSLGTANSAFTNLGTLTGKVLAVSHNGNSAIFSDTLHTPNQVYVAGSQGTTILNISGAIAAGFSPDGLKAFILGNGGNTLYVYSQLQSLRTIPLTGSANAVAFSANGAFALLSGGAASPAVTAYALCNNSLAATIPLTGAAGNPTSLKVLSDGVHLVGVDDTGFDYITTAVSDPAFPTLCPQSMIGKTQHISLGQGTFNPIGSFVSPDGSRIYVVASDRSIILFYDFNTASTGGIPLANNPVTGQAASPIAASMSVDGTLIYVAGSDGTLHQVSTASDTDLLQISFPNLPSRNNPFCALDPATGPCQLNFVGVKP